ARPGVIGGARHDTGRHRVSMDIAQESVEVPVVLDERGLVPALKQMADAIVAAVEPLGVDRMQAGHDFREGGGAGPDGEVRVVGHQAVGEELEAELLAAAREQTQVLVAVYVAAKECPALVAASGDVIQPAGDLQSRQSCQTMSPRYQIVATGRLRNQKSGLTP